MFIIRKSLYLGLFLLFCTTAVEAQYENGRYEITPFFGTRFGGTIDLSQSGNPNVDYLKIKNSEDFGIMGDVSFWGSFQGEFMWNRQPTSLTSHDPNTNTFSPVANMNFDMYQFSVLYHFLSPNRKLRPFAVAGLGFSHYGVGSVNGQNALGFSNRFAYNLGGGVKYYFSSHWDYEQRYGGRRRILHRGKRNIVIPSMAVTPQRRRTRRSRAKRTLA